MAIDIYSEPNLISSPYRPCFIDVSSDAGTISSMIADVYIDGTLRATVDKEPIIGTTNTFRFEVGDVLQKYLTSEFNTVTAQFQDFTDTTSALPYYIRAFEVTDNGTTLDTSWTANGAGVGYAQSTTAYSFNGVNQHTQLLDDRIANDNTKSFLTNRPQNSKVLNNVPFHLGILTDYDAATVGQTTLQYDGINGTGTLLDTSGTTDAVFTNKKVTFGFYPSSFNASTKSIVVNANAGSFDPANAITETLTLNVVEPCGDEVIMYWQNHWGEFDYYFFSGRYMEKTKTKSQSITNRLNLSYNYYDRGERDLKKDNQREFEVFTQVENKATVAWLSEIAESVDVFLWDGTNRISIIIDSVSRKIEDSEDVVTQLSVKYRMANKRINQIG